MAEVATLAISVLPLPGQRNLTQAMDNCLPRRKRFVAVIWASQGGTAGTRGLAVRLVTGIGPERLFHS